MKKSVFPFLGAGLAALTAAATGAVYAVAFHAPNRTQNNDYSVVKTEKIAPIYDHILSLIDKLNRIPYEPVYIESYDGNRLRGRLYDAPEGAPIAIKTNDNAKAEKLLNAAGVKTLGMEDLV